MYGKTRRLVGQQQTQSEVEATLVDSSPSAMKVDISEQNGPLTYTWGDEVWRTTMGEVKTNIVRLQVRGHVSHGPRTIRRMKIHNCK